MKSLKGAMLVIDGSSMLASSYHSTLPADMKSVKDEDEKAWYFDQLRQTRDGIYTNAVNDMFWKIMFIIKTMQPSYIVFAFDKSRATFRRQMYPEYKKNRKTTQAPLKAQINLMEKILLNLGFKVFADNMVEADDIIGSLAKQYSRQVPVYLMTKDGDYYQLVDQNIHLIKLQPSRTAYESLASVYGTQDLPYYGYEFDTELVKSVTGVYPYQIPDLKGIVGDTSDNIPGIKGIAEKTAVPLISCYGSLENLYRDIHASSTEDVLERWKGIGISKGKTPYNKANSEEAEKMAVLSKKLGTIITNIKFNLPLESFRTGLSKQEFMRIVQMYELKEEKKTA